MYNPLMIPLDLPDADILYDPSFLRKDEAFHYFKIFKDTLPWQQDTIKVFGKTYLQPRLTSLFGNNGKPYSYSNLVLHPNLFTKELLELKQKVEAKANITFTSCLLNLYRDGKDSNGWHSDNEKELGKDPVIASVSLGQERFFHIRHKNDKTIKHKMLLQHGSLLLMQGETQRFWQHHLPKTSRPIKERINLTFRVIK